MSEDEAVPVEHRTPGEVFGLLSNDLRVEIIQALGNARKPLSFSALREGVDERGRDVGIYWGSALDDRWADDGSYQDL